MEPAQILLSVVAVLACGIAAWSVHRSLSLEDRLRSEASGALAKGRADFEALAESVEEMISTARKERARADGRRGGRPPNPQPENGGQQWTRESYRNWVERNGRTLPEVEAALGL